MSVRGLLDDLFFERLLFVLERAFFEIFNLCCGFVVLVGGYCLIL